MVLQIIILVLIGIIFFILGKINGKVNVQGERITSNDLFNNAMYGLQNIPGKFIEINDAIKTLNNEIDDCKRNYNNLSDNYFTLKNALERYGYITHLIGSEHDIVNIYTQFANRDKAIKRLADILDMLLKYHNLEYKAESVEPAKIIKKEELNAN